MHTQEFTLVFVLSTLSLIVIIPTQSASTQSTRILNNGGISSGGLANLLFSTDFSGLAIGTYLGEPCLTMSGQSAGTLALNLLGGNPLKNYFITDSSSDTCWIDDTSLPIGSRQYNTKCPITGHNGQRYVIGMECHSGKRNEFNFVHVENWLPATDAYYLSVWMYLPSTWSLPSSEWYALSDVWQEESEGYLKSEFHLDTYTSGTYGLDLQYGYPSGSGINSKHTLHRILYNPLFGQWFKLEMYLNAQTGREILWLDNQLVCDTDLHNPTVDFPSIPPPGYSTWLITLAKIYFSCANTGNFQLWVSDLQIYDTLPFTT